jgi:MarR family transcriptional regulator for hemolysin
MTEDGWIVRRESNTDRRAKTVHLTPQSRAVVKKIYKVAARLRSELLADINTKDLDTCIRVLQQIKQSAGCN